MLEPIALMLATAVAAFAYLSYRLGRPLLQGWQGDQLDYIEAVAAIVFAVLAAMTLVALSVSVSAAAP